MNVMKKPGSTFSDGKKTWTIDSGKIQRMLEYNRGYGFRTTSLVNPDTGHDFISDRHISEEFSVIVDGKTITGINPALELHSEKTVKTSDGVRVEIEMEVEGLGVELCYFCYNNMPVIRKKIKIINKTVDRRFDINGMFISEHIYVKSVGNTDAAWVNGITDPISPNVFSYLDHGLEERRMESGEKRILTNNIPRDMSHMQQWNRGKIPAVNHSNYSYFPWMALWDPESREGIFLGIEWSGLWRIELDSLQDALSISVSPDPGFTHCLGPGESLCGIDFFEGIFKGGPEEAGYATQFFFDTHLAMISSKEKADNKIAAPFSVPYACLNSWFAFRTDINEELLKAQIDEAARLGFEAYVVDYGWSISPADRRENRNLFPSGLKDFSDYVKMHGLKFGLWVCITAFDNNIASAGGSDGWFIITEGKEVHDEQNVAGKCACLASGYKDYLKNELDRVISEYGVDWLKFDQNMFFECHAKDHEHQNSTDSVYFQVKAFYEILDFLLEKHPGLFIECALSGALVLDYGILQRSHTVWINDDTRSYFVRRFFYGMSYPLPPRYCTSAVALPHSNQDPSAGDISIRKDYLEKRHYFDYFYRTLLMGSFIYFDDITKLPAEAYESLKRVIELYKTVRRRIKGAVKHILPQPRDPREWDAVEIYDERLKEGLVFIFRPSSPLSEKRIRLTGLDKDTVYAVHSENSNCMIAAETGELLMNSGIIVKIEETSGSEILHFRET